MTLRISQYSSQDCCVSKWHYTKQEIQDSYFNFVKQFKWLCSFVDPTERITLFFQYKGVYLLKDLRDKIFDPKNIEMDT